MMKRIVFLLTLGAAAMFAASASAQCGNCAPQVQYMPMPQPTCCQPAPVMQQPCCQPAPMPVQSCGCGCGETSWFSRMFGSSNNNCYTTQPAPVYTVNQGPVYSGPNVQVQPAAYQPYGVQQPYPYVGYGNAYPAYYDPYRPRYRARYSVRFSYYNRPRPRYHRIPPRGYGPPRQEQPMQRPR